MENGKLTNTMFKNKIIGLALEKKARNERVNQQAYNNALAQQALNEFGENNKKKICLFSEMKKEMKLVMLFQIQMVVQNQKNHVVRNPLSRNPLQRKPLSRNPLPRKLLSKNPLQREPLSRNPLQRKPLSRNPL